MEQVIGSTVSESKKRAMESKMDSILEKMDNDIREIKKTNKESSKVKKLIERSHQQLRVAMARLDSH